MRWQPLKPHPNVPDQECISQRSVGGVLFCRVRYAAGCTMPEHDHSEASFSALLAGSACHRTDGRPEESLGAGPLDFHPSRRHDWSVGPEGAESIEVIVTDPTRPLASLFDGRLRDRAALGDADLPHRMAQELARPDAARSLALECLFVEAATQAEFAPMLTPAESPEPRWLRKVVESLHEEEGELSLTSLAAEVGVVPTHLAATFRRRFGATVGEARRSIRLAHACRLLRDRTMGLAEVALAAGFFDQAHFTRAFRARFGVTPGYFREVTVS